MQKIEENNRMGKTRDLFKKIKDTKGTFCARMGSIKDRNGMDLTEAEVANRFKGLDLIVRVPEELWMEVSDILQETVSNTIPKKKEMQKGKMVV